MQSDLVLNTFRFNPGRITESTRNVCNHIRENDAATQHVFIQSREPGRLIPCRIVRPEAEDAVGVFLHFHGGGMNDTYLQRLANASRCVTLSVGYRLAPEHPFPEGIQDCFDVADELVKNGTKEFGGSLNFIGGESAGAYLTVQTFFHLAGVNSKLETLKGLVLSYGAWSWSWLPSAYMPDTGANNLPSLCDAFESEYGTLASKETCFDHDLKRPAVSPLYRVLTQLRGRLPPALFLCGTADPLIDDTILLSAHWQMAEGQATVRFIPGAPHAFGAELISRFLEELR
ncbi:uncharacterized protein NECHADRAFT_93175 [Fusarium vanettenii 77-13-4]|uniref:Alpha/beta hydrolase fold-3 domain-containing protein n=1 Tax=Fusarium vanettenii (strain ATCC MYA-4622 / CBS 123669 / FGSC 9596 / NRRL 45880 / 77-13-4) TaxID=660122 RepID=C7ZM54_FUSV7|nr:uncharacterized protein NECHADRAFT_93175 [Fusarium vanettenii 77-13-4]EEU34907.1 hypothetical protein NECHADRAFT_93175 [Fusarium vanettenii 77-13-4]